MEYVLKGGPVKKDRYRIGFLDDNQNHDFHIQVMMGIIEAAKEFDVDIIRFGYYSSHIAYKFTHQVDMVLDHIEQYDLDGLMFLGWTRAGVMYNRENFLARFGSIPLLSIGTEYDDLPSVYFRGDSYIEDITRHLIEVHGYSRIALIDHPRTDARRDAYRKVMEHFGIYDPRYYVSDTDLKDYAVEDRNERALEILLDERKLDVEAIVTLNVIETGYLFEALEKRGIKVPSEIAITSYEDGEAAKYLTPGFTTVYFPWKELGYHGCKRMVEILKDGRIPKTTALKTKIIYRESCGCLPEPIRSIPIETFQQADFNLADMDGEKTAELVRLLEMQHAGSGMDIRKLVEEFLQACKVQEERIFLQEFGRQLRCRRSDETIGSFLVHLRERLYPYLLRDTGLLLWAGDLFNQSQVFVSEALAAHHGIDIVEAKKTDQILQDVSQSLLVNFSLENIVGSLETGLLKLGIPSCFLFISNAIFTDSDVEENLFENSVLVFCSRDGKREKTAHASGSVKKQLTELLSEKRIPVSFAYLLHVTDEIMGFALFEPGPLDESIYQMLSTNISTALRGLVLLDRLNNTYGKLVEHARREGMADIAADILHNIGNILNSISVSMHLIEEGARSTVFDDLSKASVLLEKNMGRIEEFLSDDPRGKKLMQFYLRLGISASRLQEQLRFNVERLKGKVNAINETIAAQQSYAGVDMKMEELSIEPVLEDAIKVNMATLEKCGIRVERNYLSSFKAVFNRAKLFFVIVNIIANARDAMADGNGTRTITISMCNDGAGKLLRFDDTGTGLREEWLERVFEYGFTSKQGRYGYGLYNCSVYMEEMGGSISAESDGPGKGASFILRFS